MNKIEFKVIETLAEEIGNSMSISDITKKIRQNYAMGDYKNIHCTIQNLSNKKITTIEKIGNTIIVELNFKNYLLVDLLTETESIKKIKFLEKFQQLQIVLSEINTQIKDFREIKSLLLLNPERNAKLNRLELLIILNQNKTKEIKKITKILETQGNIHNIKIEPLILEYKVFLNYLTSQETNMIKEVLKNKLVLFKIETFWMEIRDIINKGYNIESKDLMKLTDMSENEHVYNLERFGYTEFGNRMKYEEHIGIEFLITSILVKEENIRHVEAVPIILAKNESKINYDLLIFLSMKYGTIEKLYGMLKAINAIKPMKKISKAIKGLSHRKIQEIEADTKDIEEKLRLYNVIK